MTFQESAKIISTTLAARVYSVSVLFAFQHHKTSIHLSGQTIHVSFAQHTAIHMSKVACPTIFVKLLLVVRIHVYLFYLKMAMTANNEPW